MNWTVETFGKIVDAEINALDPIMKARLSRIKKLIEAYGPEALKMPLARHLTGPLWEIRLQGSNRIGRAIYVTFAGRRLIILRVFIKKTQKTPAREIELAFERARKLMI